MKRRLPAGLVDANLELFADGDEVKALYCGKTMLFSELPARILDVFREEMLSNTTAIIALNTAGFRTIAEMLKKYVWCNYGGFDNSADYDNENQEFTKEYWLCGYRDSCPFNHNICGQLIAPNGEYLTKQEVKIIKLIAQGHFDTELADALNISPNTIISYKANIFRKLQVNSKNEVTIFAYENNLVK